MLTTHTFQIDSSNVYHMKALIEFLAKISFAVTETDDEAFKFTEKPAETVFKVPTEKVVDKPAEKAVEKVAEKQVEKPAEKEHDGMKISEVRAMLQEKVSIGDNREKIFDKLRELNAESITTLEPKHYKAIYDYMATL